MSRLSEIEWKLAKLEDKSKTKKPFKLPGKINRLMKQSNKKIGFVLVQYLTSKYDIMWKLCPIVSGNLVVINNKVHVLNPKKVFRYGRNLWYIIREIDRQPVSNDDYDEVRTRKMDTDADVPLIKAVLGAVEKKQAVNLGGKTIWIILGIVVLAVIAYFIFKGGA